MAAKPFKWPLLAEPRSAFKLIETRSGGMIVAFKSDKPELLEEAKAIGFQPQATGIVVTSLKEFGHLRSEIAKRMPVRFETFTVASFKETSHFVSQKASPPSRTADKPPVSDRDRALDAAIENAEFIAAISGREIYEDGGGRYLVSGDPGTGIRKIIPEHDAAEANPTNFLRGVNEGVYRSVTETVAGEVIHKHRVFRWSEMDRIAVALTVPGPHGKAPLFAGEAAIDQSRALFRKDLLGHIGRHIRQSGLEAQKEFLQAQRLTENLTALESSGRRTKADGTEAEAPDMPLDVAVAIRRVLGLKGVVAADLEIISPNGAAGTLAAIAKPGASVHELGAEHGNEQRLRPASVQIIDLRGQGSASADMALGAISKRTSEGHSVVLVDGAADADQSDRLRRDIGLIYALESVMHYSPGFETGGQAAGVTVFAVGMRRPEPLLSLPEAATRTLTANGPSDLWQWGTETLRSRGRIADWVREQDAAADDENTPEDQTAPLQVPYRSLSQTGEAVTMVPRALQGATQQALARLGEAMDVYGGVDQWLADALGRDRESIGASFSPEQIDAIAMAHDALARGRGFLEADQTGIGKGRAMAGIAGIWLRGGPERKVVYFTESAEVNIPDVWRDIRAIGVDDLVQPIILGHKARIFDEEGVLLHQGLSSNERKALFAGGWPAQNNMLVTTYSLLSRPTSETTDWLLAHVDENTLIIADETQNALNPQGNTGHNMRRILEQTPAQVFATATHMRDPRGADLYSRLLPENLRTEGLISSITDGGNAAQEAFTTMLVSDGVMIRRSHDLASVDFEVRLPLPEQTRAYHENMERLAPIIAAMLQISGDAHTIVSRHVDVAARRLRQQDDVPDADAARARAAQMNMYSVSFGGPLAQLTDVYLNALKVDQTVQEAIAELEMGRKPMISLHSTNETFLKSLALDETGAMRPQEELDALPPVTIREQVKRIHSRLYKARIDGEAVDLRDQNPHLRRQADEIDAMIDTLPDLPASPIDALIERLGEQTYNGRRIEAGEVTGRRVAYRGGQFFKRSPVHKRDIIDAYNNGSLDVLIFNGAGATGGSYHASPEFQDQRPRTMLEMQTPPDVIKYVQGQGRGNRYGQVAKPKIVSIVTGLTPEMRLMAFRNAKLRALGATVEGNRDHPMLLADVPDVINSVGDAAANRMLLMRPDVARRLDLGHANNDELDDDQALQELENGLRRLDADDLGRSSTQNLANKVMARSILLPVDEQAQVCEHLTAEFEVLIQDMDAQNRNPLRPRRLDGRVEVMDVSTYSAVDPGQSEDVAQSAFNAPLQIATGMYVTSGKAVGGNQLMEMIQENIGRDGAEGLAFYADRIEDQQQNYLLGFAPGGTSVQDAINENHPRVMNVLGRLQRLTETLRVLRPGAMFSGSLFRQDDLGIVVGVSGPAYAGQIFYESAYNLQVIRPGESAARRVTLSSLTEYSRYVGSILETPEEGLAIFDDIAQQERSKPIQVLLGNTLSAISVAKKHRLGSITLFNDGQGVTHRGVVVNPDKADLTRLPVPVSAACVVDLARTGVEHLAFLRGEVLPARSDGELDEKKPLLSIKVQENKQKVPFLVVSAKPFNRAWADYWAKGGMPELYQVLTGKELPAEPKDKSRSAIRGIYDLDDDRLGQVAAAVDRAIAGLGLQMQLDGRYREAVSLWRETQAAPEAAPEITSEATPEAINEIAGESVEPALHQDRGRDLEPDNDDLAQAYAHRPDPAQIVWS